MTNISRNPGLGKARQAAELTVTEISNHATAIEQNATRGSGISVADDISLQDAANALYAAAQAEADTTKVRHIVRHLPFYAGCYAFSRILEDHYGVQYARSEQSIFGPIDPVQYTIPISPTEKATVTLGAFSLNGMKVKTTERIDDNGIARLEVIVTCRNVDRPLAMNLFTYLDAAPNVWAGQYLIYDSDANEPRMPEIKQPSLTLDDIALNAVEATACQQFLTHIDMHERIASELDIPFKRGVLLWGAWGTGKTLAAAVFMTHAINAGITVIYEKSWGKLLSTMHLARNFGPCLVFCEDIDLATNRTLTNLLDDAALKDAPISLVVTTNHPERLDPAITRSGRMDICIRFDLPESDTRCRILEVHGVPASTYSDAVSKATHGMTGADLAEVAKRARVTAFGSQRDMTTDDVLGAAATMVRPPKYVEQPQLDTQLKAIFKTGLEDLMGLCEGMDNTVDSNNTMIDRIDDRVADIHDQTC